MPGGEVRVEEEPLDFEGVLAKLAAMMGHTVVVAIEDAAQPADAPAAARPLQVSGRLQAAISGQPEISKRRTPGRDVFICSLDTGGTIALAERRLTGAVFRRLPDYGNETLVLTLGGLRMTIEDLDAFLAHQGRG